MEADLILLGHGSRRGTATDEGLREATRRLQSLAPQLRVRMAAWEFTEPSLDEVVGGLAAEGSRRIVVVPYFLFDGKHIKEEIPEWDLIFGLRFEVLAVNDPSLTVMLPAPTEVVELDDYWW